MTFIYDIANSYIGQMAALDPLAATRIGVPGHDAEMTDLSPSGADALSSVRRRTLAELVAAPIENDRDRIANEAMKQALELAEELHEAGDQYRLNGHRNASTNLRGTFDLMPRATEADWRNILARLRLTPEGLAGYRRTLEEGQRKGIPSTRRPVAEAVTKSMTYGGAAGIPTFFQSLMEAFDKTGIADEDFRDDLEAAVAGAAVSYIRFGRFLSEQFMDTAIERDAVGSELYQLSSRSFNGIELDLEETYAWGWEELYRIEREMQETCQHILPGASVEEVKQFLESDPARAIEARTRSGNGCKIFRTARSRRWTASISIYPDRSSGSRR